MTDFDGSLANQEFSFFPRGRYRCTGCDTATMRLFLEHSDDEELARGLLLGGEQGYDVVNTNKKTDDRNLRRSFQSASGEDDYCVRCDPPLKDVLLEKFQEVLSMAKVQVRWRNLAWQTSCR
jgi:hypothetical protein